MEIAKEKGNKIIGLCGYSGGKVKEMSDICLHVNINNMQIVEDLHTLVVVSAKPLIKENYINYGSLPKEENNVVENQHFQSSFSYKAILSNTLPKI